MSPSRATTSDEVVKTSDLTMATYLIASGYEPRMIREGEKDGHPIGAWEFPASEGLSDHIEMFEADMGVVEPKQFHQVLTSTRRSLFSFLDIGSER